MKRIVDGKRYDTDTATMLALWDNGHLSSDFHYHYHKETLYKTRNGSYFLHGEGGALSTYGRQYGKNQGSGEEIIPLTADDAFCWLQEHATAACEEEFPDKIQDA